MVKAQNKARSAVVVVILLVSSRCSGPAKSQKAVRTADAHDQPKARVDVDTPAKRIERLEAVAPGQGALMSQLGYQFGNLWFALERRNWPLAAFYLHECREALEQAVDARPVRALSTGDSLNLKGIAEAMDNTQFADLERAIADKEGTKAQSIYRDALIVCHSCHQAAEMPFLRLQIPDRPPSALIQFDPVPPDSHEPRR